MMHKEIKATVLQTSELSEDELALYYLCDALAQELAQRHNLGYQRVVPVDSEQIWGRCNPDGILEICFFKYIEGDDSGFKNVRWSINRNEVIRTLCHELAHLRYSGHGESFWRFCNSLIDEVNVITDFRIKHEQNRWQHSGL